MIAPLGLAWFAADVPIDISSDDARAAASRELTDPAYPAAQPPLLERVVTWIVNRLTEWLDAVSSVVPGGPGGLLVLALAAVVVAIIVRLRVGKVAMDRRGGGRAVFSGRPQSSAEHRQAADQAFARGDLVKAVRERFRAIVRDLEQRGVLDERSGRTVDETAAEAGRQLPGRATELRHAAQIFDDIVYGGRAATAEDYQRLATIDAAVRTERPTLVGMPM